MPIAKLNLTVIANSLKTVTVDGNYYCVCPPASAAPPPPPPPPPPHRRTDAAICRPVPRDSLVEKYFKPSSAGTKTTCGWKGTAEYLDLELEDGKVRRASSRCRMAAI